MSDYTSLDGFESTATRRVVIAGLGAGLALAIAGGSSSVRAASGSDLAKFALRFEGKPYVWAGDSPRSGFDCSGLTMYCVRKVFGMDITHSVKLQWDYGTAVSQSALESGDLVFFKNTYERGLSHVGIYIGRGKFVHAENERTGVVVTPLDSTYYTEHYKGARRLR